MAYIPTTPVYIPGPNPREGGGRARQTHDPARQRSRPAAC